MKVAKPKVNLVQSAAPHLGAISGSLSIIRFSSAISTYEAVIPLQWFTRLEVWNGLFRLKGEAFWLKMRVYFN